MNNHCSTGDNTVFCYHGHTQTQTET